MGGPFFVIRCGPRLERARAQREKRAGGTFWCPCACRGAAAPRASLVARGRVTERERGTRKGSPLTLPLPCGGRECRQQNLWAVTN